MMQKSKQISLEPINKEKLPSRQNRAAWVRTVILSIMLSALLAGTLTALLPSTTWAQEDWSEGLSERDRFRLYPHVDAGLRALEQNRFDKASAEFTRAAELVPNNPVIAQYLAQAYAGAGDLRQAIATLDAQIKVTPSADYLTAARAVYTQQITDKLLDAASTLRANPSQLRQFLTTEQPFINSAYTESVWLSLLADASTPKDDLLLPYKVQFPQNVPLKEELLLFMRLRTGDTEAASEQIAQWPAQQLQSYRLVDALSFQLLGTQHPAQALELLTKALPEVKASNNQRETLVNRLILAQAAANDPSAVQAYLREQIDKLDSPVREREWLRIATNAYGDELAPFVTYKVRHAQNRPLLESAIEQRLTSGSALPADTSWQSLIEQLGTTASDSMLDSLSFRLVQAHENQLAWQVLMDRYPFDGLQSVLQTELTQRLALIANRDPSLMSAKDKQRLSKPLPTAKLRQVQANMLAAVSDCAGIQSVLGDWSPAYSASQWMLLGNCYDKEQRSGLSQYAIEQALKLNPSIDNKRALAFVAYENKDNELAFALWQEIVASGDITDEDWLAAITTALAANRINVASQWLTQYDQADEPRTARYWALKARALSTRDLPAAINAMQASVTLEPSAENYLQLAQWQQQTGDQAGAIESLQSAVSLAPDNGEAQADLGFLLYSVHNLPSAKTHLVSALKLRTDDITVIEQLAYIDQQLGLNQASSQYTERAVDHLLRYPASELNSQQQETLFALRRMNEDLARRWTLSFDALTGTGPSASVQSPLPGETFKSYSQLELDYRLGKQPINNGKTVSAYARVFGGSGTENSALPIYAPTFGVGLRVKPFSDYVVYFAIEKQIPLDHGASPPANTMLRASGSFFSDGDQSDDWHPVGPGWLTQNLYLDSAYYLSDQAWSLTADYRVGYHHKLHMGQTIEPYARLLGNKISSESTPDLRVGAGVRWNLWADESRYKAYATRYYLGLEVQGAIETYQSDKVTVLVTLGARW